MKKSFQNHFISSVILLLSAGSVPAQDKKVTYDEHVRPVLREHCFSCHNQDRAKGGWHWTVMQRQWKVEVAVKLYLLEIWILLGYGLLSIMMMNQSCLPCRISFLQKKLKVISEWILGGALENSGSKAVAKPQNNLAFSAASLEIPQGRQSCLKISGDSLLFRPAGLLL